MDYSNPPVEVGAIQVDLCLSAVVQYGGNVENENACEVVV